MEPYYSHNGLQFYAGHVLTVWPALAAQGVRVQTIVTSIPYYGLRAYGTTPQIWGGDPPCDHDWQVGIKRRAAGGEREYGSYDGGVGRGPAPVAPESATCARCTAWRGELGQEPTPDLFVAHIVAVFRAVRQVLRPDGTLWLNVGDSYTRNGGTQGGGNRELMHLEGKQRRMAKTPPGYTEKQLLLIPARVALALQADGWVLRNEIIWAKTAPMPESVQDRFTRAHEQIFLFSQRPRYFMDMDAVREPTANSSGGWQSRGRRGITTQGNGETAQGAPVSVPGTDRNPRDVWTLAEPLARLRDDLSPEQRAYALNELAKRGLL